MLRWTSDEHAMITYREHLQLIWGYTNGKIAVAAISIEKSFNSISVELQPYGHLFRIRYIKSLNKIKERPPLWSVAAQYRRTSKRTGLDLKDHIKRMQEIIKFTSINERLCN